MNLEITGRARTGTTHCESSRQNYKRIKVIFVRKFLGGNTHDTIGNYTEILVLCAQLRSHVQLFVTLWTVGCQAPLSKEFPRQEYWSGLPIPFPRESSQPGIKPATPVSPALAGGFFTTESP